MSLSSGSNDDQFGKVSKFVFEYSQSGGISDLFVSMADDD